MWSQKTGTQTNQYLYKYLVESNKELYWVLSKQLSQMHYGPVVTYCMVYYYTKRATLARLLANEGPAIYVVFWTGILLYLYVTV